MSVGWFASPADHLPQIWKDCHGRSIKGTDGNHVTDLQFRSGSSSTYQPACPMCGARMWLSRIEPDRPDHDKRIFECPQCENVVSEIVKYR
jgi:hypothetical protein